MTVLTNSAAEVMLCVVQGSLEKVMLISLETVVLRAVSALQSKSTRNTLMVKQIGVITRSKGECTSWENTACLGTKVLGRIYYRIWTVVECFGGNV